MAAAPQITARELAERLNGTLVGDERVVVTGVATLEEAGPESLSWVGSPDLLGRLADSRAAIALVPLECQAPAGRTVIQVDDPDLALCRALRWLAPEPEYVPFGVHPSAIIGAGAVTAGAAIGPHVTVGKGAVVGPDTQVHAGVRIGEDVRIGRDCVLWHNVVVRERARIGDRVVIHPNATIGADGFGYLQRDGRHIKIPQVGTVLIEDDVEIGANVCIDRARSGVTRIRRGTKIDNLVQIAHNCDLGEDCVIVAQCGIAGSCSFGRGVVLGGQVGVADHVHLGDGVHVNAMSGIAHDVREAKDLRGVPAVDVADFTRQQAAVRRLPKLVEQVRELKRRVRELESATDH